MDRRTEGRGKWRLGLWQRLVITLLDALREGKGGGLVDAPFARVSAQTPCVGSLACRVLPGPQASRPLPSSPPPQPRAASGTRKARGSELLTWCAPRLEGGGSAETPPWVWGSDPAKGPSPGLPSLYLTCNL